MRILIVAATDFEIDPLRKEFPSDDDDEMLPKSYSYRQLSVDILIAGIGSVATVFNMMKHLRENKYDLLINIGIAGSFTKELRIGTVVNVVEEQFTDLGIEDEDKFYTLFEKGYIKNNEPPFIAGIIRNKTKILSSSFNRLIKVLGTTANTVHGNVDFIEKLKDKFCLDTETMEGGAFFYVAQMEKIPFIQVRSISNFVAPRKKSNWNADLAIENLTCEMIKILNELSE